VRLDPGLRRYRNLLQATVERGYEIRSVGAWVRGSRDEDRTVLLRHDVDADPRGAARMAEVETELGIAGTWYVRWRTASPDLIGRLQGYGLEVGLHYECLSRLGRRLNARTAAELEPLESIAATYLEAEVCLFAHLFGGCPSICPHGDSGFPAARNANLLRHKSLDSLGVDFDARAAMAQGERAGWAWLTDDRQARVRGMPPGGDPVTHPGDRLMLVIHPNNWVRARRQRVNSRLSDAPPC
jgi:hypothetical protein